MKYLIVSGNPKKDGLCHAVTEEVRRGAADGGAEVEVLSVGTLERCQGCGDGWGTCYQKHVCAFGNDGFSAAQESVKAAGQLCFITPVDFGEMAESLNCFLDRLRRCEVDMPLAPRTGQKAALSGKQILLVASAGGSGMGALTCLEQMDRFCRFTGAVIFDHIGINRWNNDYKKSAVYAAAKAMAGGRKAGESLQLSDD
jgi:multimeric flavodoxin WrbA